MRILLASLLVVSTCSAFAHQRVTYQCENSSQESMTMVMNYPDNLPVFLSYKQGNEEYCGQISDMVFTKDDFEISIQMPIAVGTLMATFPLIEMNKGALRAKNRFCDSLRKHDDYGMPLIPPSFCSSDPAACAYGRIKPRDEDPNGPVEGMPQFICSLSI